MDSVLDTPGLKAHVCREFGRDNVLDVLTYKIGAFVEFICIFESVRGRAV